MGRATSPYRRLLVLEQLQQLVDTSGPGDSSRRSHYTRKLGTGGLSNTCLRVLTEPLEHLKVRLHLDTANVRPGKKGQEGARSLTRVPPCPLHRGRWLGARTCADDTLPNRATAPRTLALAVRCWTEHETSAWAMATGNTCGGTTGVPKLCTTSGRQARKRIESGGHARFLTETTNLCHDCCARQHWHHSGNGRCKHGNGAGLEPLGSEQPKHHWCHGSHADLSAHACVVQGKHNATCDRLLHLQRGCVADQAHLHVKSHTGHTRCSTRRVHGPRTAPAQAAAAGGATACHPHTAHFSRHLLQSMNAPALPPSQWPSAWK
jgi:hypothetical protein